MVNTSMRHGRSKNTRSFLAPLAFFAGDLMTVWISAAIGTGCCQEYRFVLVLRRILSGSSNTIVYGATGDWDCKACPVLIGAGKDECLFSTLYLLPGRKEQCLISPFSDKYQP
jgi:hypothetical protein